MTRVIKGLYPSAAARTKPQTKPTADNLVDEYKCDSSGRKSDESKPDRISLTGPQCHAAENRVESERGESERGVGNYLKHSVICFRRNAKLKTKN